MKNEGGGKFDYLFKILVIGETAVGKTCLLLRYTDNTFNVGHLATIGIDFKIKEVDIEGKNVKLQIWDTAGQDRFKSITKTYYKGSQGIVLVYDVTDIESFNKIQHWMKQIDNNANKNVRKVLCGNKCDKEGRVVTEKQGQKMADSYKIKFFETSAKADINVKEMFDYLSNEIFKNFEEKEKEKENINIKKPKDDKEDKKCCK